MKRDKPGNADYSIPDMTEYSLLFPRPRLTDEAAISPLSLTLFTGLLASKRSIWLQSECFVLTYAAL